MRTATAYRSRPITRPRRHASGHRFPAPGPSSRRPALRPCYLGARSRRAFFLPRRTQQMRTPSPAAQWAGGGAMLLAMACWGVLVVLLTA